MSQEQKYENKVAIVGKVEVSNPEAGLATVTSTISKANGGEIIHRHAVKVSPEQAATLTIGERVKILGRLLTLTNEQGRETETLIQAGKIEPAGELPDSSRARVVGVLVRPADIFDRNVDKGNKPFANLRLKVGAAYVWAKCWNALFRHVKANATMGSVFQMTGNLGYQYLGKHGEVKLTEITGFNPETSMVIMKAAVVDTISNDFEGYVAEDEGAIELRTPMVPVTAGAADGGTAPNLDTIPF